MVITQKDIQYLREHAFMNISAHKEAEIPEKLSTESIEFEYTEQDLYEQLRKILRK